MIPIQDLSLTERLRSGLEVTIRAVRPDDKERINEAFRNLEPETIYTRYFMHKTSLTEADLKWATELDFEKDVALVVTMNSKDKEIVIGGSRFSVLKADKGATKKAEIAFTVEEDFQGQGMASRLLKHMISIARQMGIDSFEAEVLPENGSMLSVFKKSGLSLRQSFEDGSIHLSMALNENTD